MKGPTHSYVSFVFNILNLFPKLRTCNFISCNQKCPRTNQPTWISDNPLHYNFKRYTLHVSIFTGCYTYFTPIKFSHYKISQMALFPFPPSGMQLLLNYSKESRTQPTPHRGEEYSKFWRKTNQITSLHDPAFLSSSIVIER